MKFETANVYASFIDYWKKHKEEITFYMGSEEFTPTNLRIGQAEHHPSGQGEYGDGFNFYLSVLCTYDVPPVAQKEAWFDCFLKVKITDDEKEEVVAIKNNRVDIKNK